MGFLFALDATQGRGQSQGHFHMQSAWILGVAGPASAAMEMAIANLVDARSRVLCLVNGYFSQRMAEMAGRAGAQVLVHEAAGTQLLDLAAFEAELARIAKRHGSLVIVDAVCTLSTTPLQMDAWGIDAVITGGQKGLSCIPGVSLVAFSNAAWDRINSRSSPTAHWCLDARLATNFWHRGSYHYTAPVSGVLALHEALRLVCTETLERRFERHRRCSAALQAGIEALGLPLLVPPAQRLHSVVGVVVPPATSNRAVCQHISRQYQVEVSGSFGLPIVRIGQMGEQCREPNLFRTLHALGSTMQDLGVPADLTAGLVALERGLRQAGAVEG